MSDRLLPQRWHETPAPVTEEVAGAPRAEQESVLKVLLDFIALVRRNYRVVLVTTVACMAVLFLQLRLDQPSYRASAVVRFEDKGRALSGGLGVGAGQQLAGPITDPLL